MLNVIVSAPVLALASNIACRSEPAPLSSVLMTVKVEAWAGLAVRLTNSTTINSRFPIIYLFYRVLYLLSARCQGYFNPRSFL
jgi:hypothetical protein